MLKHSTVDFHARNEVIFAAYQCTCHKYKSRPTTAMDSFPRHDTAYHQIGRLVARGMERNVPIDVYRNVCFYQHVSISPSSGTTADAPPTDYEPFGLMWLWYMFDLEDVAICDNLTLACG